jgi:hypothetical protein
MRISLILPVSFSAVARSLTGVTFIPSDSTQQLERMFDDIRHGKAEMCQHLFVWS